MRPSKMILMAVFSLFAPVAHAAEPDAHAAKDDRGPRGIFVAGGGGFALTSGVDDEGQRAPMAYGSGGHFRFGEEVIERLTLGLELGGSGGTGDDFEAGLGGFAVQASYRPGLLTEGLVFLVGTGVGGGSLTPTTEVDDGTAPKGTGGGAFHLLAVQYELDLNGPANDGFALSPSLRVYLLPSTTGHPVRLTSFVVGLESVYYFGR